MTCSHPPELEDTQRLNGPGTWPFPIHRERKGPSLIPRPDLHRRRPPSPTPGGSRLGLRSAQSTSRLYWLRAQTTCQPCRIPTPLASKLTLGEMRVQAGTPLFDEHQHAERCQVLLVVAAADNGVA